MRSIAACTNFLRYLISHERVAEEISASRDEGDERLVTIIEKKLISNVVHIYSLMRRIVQMIPDVFGEIEQRLGIEGKHTTRAVSCDGCIQYCAIL